MRQRLSLWTVVMYTTNQHNFTDLAKIPSTLGWIGPVTQSWSAGDVAPTVWHTTHSNVSLRCQMSDPTATKTIWNRAGKKNQQRCSFDSKKAALFLSFSYIAESHLSPAQLCGNNTCKVHTVYRFEQLTQQDQGFSSRKKERGVSFQKFTISLQEQGKK